MAASANGRPPLPPSTPTVSESPTTLNTVIELAPYHQQFRAAGLAVTSREQMPDLPDSQYARLQSLGLQRARYPAVTRPQMDGSTVTPSDHGPSPDEPAVPDVPDRGVKTSIQGDKEARPSMYLAGSDPNSLLPWLRGKEQSKNQTTHNNRKFSKTHIHPSQPTTAQPLLTPLGGIIDSYFDATTLTAERNGEPDRPRTSFTVTPGATPGAGDSMVDKPLPKQPQIERRPVPPRKERRHMEYISKWPTAGVVIHDEAPRLTSLGADTVAALDAADEPAMDQIKDSSSTRSWTTEEEGIYGIDQETSSLPREDERVGEAIKGPQRSPPVPPKDIIPFKDKPEVPPRHFDIEQPKHGSAPCHRLGKSLRAQWHRATGLRSGGHHKHLPMPPTTPKETSISEDRINKDQPEEASQIKDAHSGSSKPRSVHVSEDGIPHLPFTWQLAAKSSSSFENALDAVIQKLDAMEERRQYERKVETEENRKSLAQSELPGSLSIAANPKPSSIPITESQGQMSKSDPPSNDVAEQSDRNISNKDVLLGLKMAICAACDEDLDAWIRSKTGLRLRRFLADLKSFDSVTKDRRVPPAQPLSRQIRRNIGEDRRLQAEKTRRRQSSKKAPWAHCFGADGKASVVKSSEEA